MGGTTHRSVVEPLCEWLGWAAEQRARLGHSLDLIQIAFDLADNLADEESDALEGRAYSSAYHGIPHAVRFSLPAYLISACYANLLGGFPEGGRAAVPKVHAVLSEMIVGQSLPSGVQKAGLVSGSQGRLLCLPAWLSPSHPQLSSQRVAELERWAQAWGTTWELETLHRSSGCAESRRAWIESVRQAHRNWPRYGPFAAREALSASRNLRPVC